MITAGDGTTAYSDCVYKKLTRHEWYRDWTVPKVGNYDIASGAPAGFELWKSINEGAPRLQCVFRQRARRRPV